MEKETRTAESTEKTESTVAEEQDQPSSEAEQSAKESSESQPTDAPPTLEEQVEQLKAENAQLKDNWLRAVAEADNIRKRGAKERETLVRVASDSILIDFLEVIDNFERALAAADSAENLEEFVKGIKLIHQQLMDALSRRGVKPLDSSGEPFDPELHEAMMQVNSDQPEDTVVDVIQKGYKINDRVLRHARVTVSKG